MDDKSGKKTLASNVTVIHVEGLDKMDKTPAKIMEELLEQFDVPEEKQVSFKSEFIEASLTSCCVSDVVVYVRPLGSRVLRLQNQIKISPGQTPGPLSADLLQPAD